jgi:hypothetical protein
VVKVPFKDTYRDLFWAAIKPLLTGRLFMNEQQPSFAFYKGIKRELFPGQHVVFADEYRKERDAIVTAWHGLSCINVVFVSGDEQKTDSYGRQLERQTSVSHMSQNAYGNFWRWPDEELVARPADLAWKK